MVRDCTSSTFKLFIQIFNIVNKAVILTRTRTRAAASRAGVAAVLPIPRPSRPQRTRRGRKGKVRVLDGIDIDMDALD